MIFSNELSKVKNSFKKIREDMEHIASKINHNYEDFIQKHSELSSKVNHLSHELSMQLHSIKMNVEKMHNTSDSKAIRDISFELKEVKNEIHNLHMKHRDLREKVFDLHDNKHSSSNTINSLNKKVEQGELELYLLKERLVERDRDMNQIKQSIEKLYEVLNEITNVEMELLKRS